MTGTLFIGLMSGTSADAIDAVLFQSLPAHRGKILGHVQQSIDSAARKQIMALSSREQDSLEMLLELDWHMAGLFAQACHRLLEKTGLHPDAVTAIGCHGQTIRHQPPLDDHTERPSYSLQIGDPNRLAELAGIDVVADFRRRDMAAGGQAAPLVPAFHAHWFGQPDMNQVVVNLGGIANLSLLQGRSCIGGFDSGPANGLMNSWISQQLGKDMDKDAAWARSGTLQHQLLDEMMQDDWFQRPPPKSTGRELFNLEWVLAKSSQAYAAADVQRTLLELSALSLIRAIESCNFKAKRILLCGGGCRNPLLVQRIADMAGDIQVQSCQQQGIEPEQVEAAAFAWLAHQRLNDKPANVVAVTGAKGPRILGGVYRA